MNIKAAIRQLVRTSGIGAALADQSRRRMRSQSPRACQFERLENRQMFATLHAGDVVYGGTNSPNQQNTYEFQASAGTQVEMVTKALTGSMAGFLPAARLFAPNGVLIRTFSESSGNQAFTLPNQTGVYTLRISDDNWSQSGSFAIGFETTRPFSPDARTLAPGGIVYGGMNNRLQKDQHVFYARAGEIYEVVLRCTPSYPGFLAKLKVIAPSGAVKLVGDGNSPSQRLNVTETGRYILMIGDDDLSQQGTYQLGLERIRTASPDAQLFRKGEIRHGDLRNLVQKDQYVFYGHRGQVVDLVIRRESGAPGFVPTVFLYGPSGRVLKTFTQASGNVRMTLAETGNFVVQVFDNDFRQTGTYSIGLEGISPWSPDARTLARNSWFFGDLRHSIQKDQFIINGSAGQVIQMRAIGQSTSPYFDPLIEVFNQAGTRVTWFRASTGPKSLALNATGRYLIQIGDSAFDATGTYSFRWS